MEEEFSPMTYGEIVYDKTKALRFASGVLNGEGFTIRELLQAADTILSFDLNKYLADIAGLTAAFPDLQSKSPKRGNTSVSTDGPSPSAEGE